MRCGDWARLPLYGCLPVCLSVDLAFVVGLTLLRCCQCCCVNLSWCAAAPGALPSLGLAISREQFRISLSEAFWVNFAMSLGGLRKFWGLCWAVALGNPERSPAFPAQEIVGRVVGEPLGWCVLKFF